VALSVRRSERRRRARGVALSGDDSAGEAGAVGRARGVLSGRATHCRDSALRRARDARARSAGPYMWGPLSAIFELKITRKENSSKQIARD
jgi:hypothetical protein